MTPQSISIEPMDEHNRRLIAHVHPPDWRNPMPPRRPYDMVVIGAGTAGLVTAMGSAGLGKKVALIERYLMGGDCLNMGCVPSKALLRSAAAAAELRSGAEHGLDLDPTAVRVDFSRVMERLRRLRASIAPHDSAERFQSAGIDVYLGNARFTAEDALDVDGATLRFKRACIATGARAAAPPIPGLDRVAYLTNENLFELTELPASLGVIGAGPIGCEMAQAFARLGSRVYLVEAMHGVLPREDREAATIVERALARDGVTLLCCGKDLQLAPAERGGVRLLVSSHGESYDQRVERVLVAVGRKPNTDGLGLEQAGIETDSGGVRVDRHLRTTNPRVFAAGDICSPYKFTHAADAQARIVVRNALLGWIPFHARADRLVVPWCTYTEPELAHVGRSKSELEQDGVAHETIAVDLASLDRAVLESATDGLLKVHVGRGGRILGATLVGRHAGESISEITAAMVHGIPLHKLAKVIHPYPTQAEIIKRAADTYFRERLLRWKRRLPFGRG